MKDEKNVTRTSLNAPNEKVALAAINATKEKGVDDPEKYGVENCCVHQFWAVIERDGTLVRGRNVLRTRRIGIGQYEVFFTGKVDQGVYVATIGRPGIATEPAGHICVALRCCPGSGLWTPFDDNRGVWIDTHDISGNFSDRAFHLVVLTH